MGNIIVGIYDSIIPTEQGGDEKLLQSEDKVHDLAVRTFSEGDPIGSNSVPLNVKVGENVVKVLVDKAELVKKLGLVSEGEIPDRGTETFVQEKILKSQIGKEINEKDLEILGQFAGHRFQDMKLSSMLSKVSSYDGFIFDEIANKAKELRNIVSEKYPELQKKEYLQALKIASYYLACVYEGEWDLEDKEYAEWMDVNLDDLIVLKTIITKGLERFSGDVIDGIYHSIGPIIEGGEEQFLVSDEREYNLPVQRFSEHEAKDPNKISLNVRLEEEVVKVLVNKKDLAETLNVEVEKIPLEHVEQFVQEKILHDLKGEAFSASELDAFKGVHGTFGEKQLILDEQQIKEIHQAWGFYAYKKAFVRSVKRLQDKLLRRHPELNQPEYLTGVRVASFVWAHKIIDEPSYKNEDIAEKILDLPLRKMNELEVLFMKGINWDISLNVPYRKRQFTDEDYKELILLSRRPFNFKKLESMIDRASGKKDEIKKKIESKAKELRDILIQNNPEIGGNEYWPADKIARYYRACIIEGTEELDESEYADYLKINLYDLKEIDSILLKGLQEKISDKEHKKLIDLSRRRFMDPFWVTALTLWVKENDRDITEKIVKRAEEFRATATKNHPELENKECRPALEMASLYLACILEEGGKDLSDSLYADYLETTPENLGLLKSILLRALEE